jgi:hypothetical protein
MSRRNTLATLAAASVLLASPAQALTVLGNGSDAPELAAVIAPLLSTTISNGVTLADILARSQESIRVAQQTSDLLRQASEVVVDVRYLAQDPNKIFDDAAGTFGITFPELEAIVRDINTTRANIAGENKDARTIFSLMRDARAAKTSTYQTLMAYNDLVDGQLDEYVKNMDKQFALSSLGSSLLAQTQDPTAPLDTKRAAVLGAQASAVTAVAAAQSASANQEIARVLQHQMVDAEADRAAAAVSRKLHEAELQDSMPANEQVDALEDLRRLRAGGPPQAPAGTDR